MERLADTFGATVEPEPALVVKPSLVRLDGPLAATAGTTSPASYETSVFNFLYARKHELGVRDVWKCRAVRIDGLLDLDDGQRVMLEVKYRMNWEKACQACAQFSWFFRHPEAQSPSPTGALVVFEEFTADWARRSPTRLLEEGWNYWYTDHSDVEDARRISHGSGMECTSRIAPRSPLPKRRSSRKRRPSEQTRVSTCSCREWWEPS